MTRWILAAEADKIQDLVFRSTHLREVVGGSHLLTRFCQEATRELLARLRGQPQEAVEGDILVADGGSFSILFDDPAEARRFGQELRRLYRATAGGTLTAAEPVEWNGSPEQFEEANGASRVALRQAKAEGGSPTAVEHLPYVAFCASCGVGLAYNHEPLHAAGRANYLCPICRAKADEEPRLRTEFTQTVIGGAPQSFELLTDTDKAAEGWDPRQYVAYLAADGNGMGEIFGRCTKPRDVKYLSKGLSEVLYESLASPTQLLMARAPGFRQWEIPMLPLILGGDDVFARLPAPYALDFARRFCQEYEERMEKVLGELEIDARPTMAAAVVICKSKYPHTLAHQHAQVLLKEAKQLAKAVALRGPAHSTVHFDLILGSRIAREGDSDGTSFRAGLRPYWVVREAQALPPQVGLPLARLIEQRYELRILPTRRLVQFRTLFAPGELPSDEDDNAGRWQPRLGQVIGRVSRSRSQAVALETALAELGGRETSGWWYDANRPGPKVSPFWGHGLPDLLDVWDFCLNLDRNRSEYEVGEV